MGKIKFFQIQLDDPQLVYWPGQTINGKVELELGEDLPIRGVNIKCRGKARVAWRESKNIYHSGEEDYLYDILALYESKDRHGAMRAGVHVFPFQFVLPYDIPSSFERPLTIIACYVRYWLKAYTDGVKDEFKLDIRVTSPLDLNGIKNAMAPGDLSATKDVCCLCCRRGPITARLRIDRSGLVPGDNVYYEAEVEDNTGRGTNGADVKLVMISTLHADDGEKGYHWDTCAKLKHGAIEPYGSDSWTGKLEIPPLAPSGLAGCSVIDTRYEIILSVNIRKTPVDLSVQLPVVNSYRFDSARVCCTAACHRRVLGCSWNPKRRRNRTNLTEQTNLKTRYVSFTCQYMLYASSI